MNNIKSIILLFLLLNEINKMWSKIISRKRIIGGKFAEPGEYTYQAALYLNMYNDKDGKYVGFCGGSLITTRFVLTAAHCLVECYQAVIFLGVDSMHELADSSVIAESSNIIPHENYQPTVYGVNDIGLVKIPAPVILTDDVTTIKLPLKSKRQKTYINRKAIVTGYGRVKANVEGESDTLKLLKVRIKDKKECSRYSFDAKQMICGKGKCGRICQGDSGSPLVIKNNKTVTQIGIVSFGTTECLKGVPNIYSRITYYLDWIEQNSDYEF